MLVILLAPIDKVVEAYELHLCPEAVEDIEPEVE